MKKKLPQKRHNKNRLAKIIKEKTITIARLANETGIDRSTLYRLINNETEMKAQQLLDLAKCLQIEASELLEYSQKDLTTLGYSEKTADAEIHTTRGLFSASLLARDPDSYAWICNGLSDPAQYEMLPGETARIDLKEGRILLGRAVDQGEFLKIPGTQRIAIARTDHEADCRLSRYHLDLTFCSDNRFLVAYAINAVEITKSGQPQQLAPQQSAVLHDQDAIHFPCNTTLYVVFKKL